MFPTGRALDDRPFPLRDAERMAAILPDAQVETIATSRAFSMIDQPDRLAELVATFASAARRGITGRDAATDRRADEYPSGRAAGRS